MSKRNEYYQALLSKNSAYEGIFFVGVASTGVFCRPVCGARKPKIENCEFFKTAEEALLASYRPCKRCRPLSNPSQVSPLVATLVEAVEANPQKRWKDSDFQALSVDATTARRQFKKRFGMTLVAYARARRMGIAMEQIRSGQAVIEAQFDAGYESGSGFRDAFAKIMGASPKKSSEKLRVLNAAWLDTPLGPMVAIADEVGLYLLEFVDRRGLEREIERMRKRTKSAIIPGTTKPLELIRKELQGYFEGQLKKFDTPLHMLGSDFQKSAWQALMAIPYGQTKSYAEQAVQIGKTGAYRAAARANASNPIAIVIPCHRIVTSSNELGGYGGGVVRKQWLLDHEARFSRDIA